MISVQFRICLALALGLLACNMLGCGLPVMTQAVEAPGDATGDSVLQGNAMGTTWRIVIADAVDDTAALEGQCAAQLESLESQMSHWRDDSELSRFNRSASTEPFAVSPELASVFDEAQRIFRLSEGAFDITAAPLVSLWGFGPDGRSSKAPVPEDIERLRKCVGSALVRLTREPLNRNTLTKTRSEVTLDLSGLAKGYAIDKLAELLDSHGMRNYLVEFGGELRARGMSSRRRTWRVGLERPDRTLTRKIRGSVELKNKAIATSGSYRNFSHDAESGNRQCHIIDPRTGRPVAHRLASVSVIAETAMTADAWATALMVLGPYEGFRRAQELGVCATFFVESESGVVENRTDALQGCVFPIVQSR